jgi:hypothetical protein
MFQRMGLHNAGWVPQWVQCHSGCCIMACIHNNCVYNTRAVKLEFRCMDAAWDHGCCGYGGWSPCLCMCNKGATWHMQAALGVRGMLWMQGHCRGDQRDLRTHHMVGKGHVRETPNCSCQQGHMDCSRHGSQGTGAEHGGVPHGSCVSKCSRDAVLPCH